MNMCVSTPKKNTSKDVAYIVIRQSWEDQEGWEKTIQMTPVAIFENEEDASDMEGAYNQEMKDREIDNITFMVIATAFYPE